MWHGVVKIVNDMVSRINFCHKCVILRYSAYMQISKCDVCQRMNRKMTTGAPEFHPIPVKQPWYMMGIDFVGPLTPQAQDRSRYILTLSDYFTKWVEAFPTPDKSAPQVASSLYKVCNSKFINCCN